MVQSVQETSLSKAFNGKYLKYTFLVFGKTLKLETGNNETIVFSTKMINETLWTSPLSQI
jgi:hypothetical protein